MSSDEAAFGKAKGYLEQAAEDGSSVYNHLYEIFHSLLKNRPNAQPPLHPKTTPDSRYDAEDVGAAERMLGLYTSLPQPQTRTIIERPNPHTTVTTTTVQRPVAPPFREVALDSRYHALCGVGLPTRDAAAVDLAMTTLASVVNPVELRYFGRVCGKEGHYDIAECQRILPEDTVPPEPYIHTQVEIPTLPCPIPAEPAGHGVNRWSYLALPSLPQTASRPSGDGAAGTVVAAGGGDVASAVASDFGGATPVGETGWYLLPDLTPQQVLGARKGSARVSGRLGAKVVVHPPFPGREANLLRAMVGRIAAATVVAPAGAVQLFSAESDDEGFDEDVETVAVKVQPLTEDVPSFSEEVAANGGVGSLAGLNRWVHTRMHIGRNGRVNVIPQRPEGEGDDVVDDEEAEVRVMEVEPHPDDFKSLLEPLSRAAVFSVVAIPRPPPPPTGEDGMGAMEEEEEANVERPPSRYGEPSIDGDSPEADVDPDDPNAGPTRREIPCWRVEVVQPSTCTSSSVAVVRSTAWPGAVAWCGGGGKDFGCVYFGDGLKRTPLVRFPQLPPQPLPDPIAMELPLQMDPSAMAEKLVLRGESLPDVDQEDIEGDLGDQESVDQ